MSARLFRIMVAVCGLLGVIALVVSFSINPAPPAGASIRQIVVWGQAHENLILAGSWLQGFGSLLEMIFIIALVHLANATQRLRGLITIAAAIIIASVSLVEVSFYISAIEGGVAGDLESLAVSLNLIKAIQHAYVIAPAPALLLSLGLVMYISRQFSHVFSYLALLLGVTMSILGLLGTFIPLQTVIDSVLSAQEVWFAAVAIALIVSARKVPITQASKEQSPQTAQVLS